VPSHFVAGDVWRQMTAFREIARGAAILAWAAIVGCPVQGATLHSHPSAFVVAKSHFGNGSIRAPVRRAPFGWKVRLPGGRWVYCRRDCSETLRVETIDFFNANAAGTGQLTNECGIFGCLDLKYAR
jgi:hypothetical protein